MDSPGNILFRNITEQVVEFEKTNFLNFSGWALSRLRIFLYLSNPYEESFQYEHQVTDYHTEVQEKNYFLQIMNHKP